MRVRLEVEVGGTTIECDEQPEGYEETLASLAHISWLVIATMSGHNGIPVGNLMNEFQTLVTEPLRQTDTKPGEPGWLPKREDQNDNDSVEE